MNDHDRVQPTYLKTSSNSTEYINTVAQHHWRRKLILLSAKVLAIVFLFFSVTGAYAYAPTIEKMVEKLIPVSTPKPISQSSKTLSTNTQRAIQELAQQQIRAEQAKDLVSTNTSNRLTTTSTTNATMTVNPGFLQNLSETIQTLTTKDPVVLAKIKLARNDRKIAQLQDLLANDKSDAAIDQAVKLIQVIGQQIGEVTTDPKILTDREILTLKIAQYSRLQTVLQKIEDTLPIPAYLKIEDARVTYVVKQEQMLLNGAPNVEVVNNIALAEAGQQVGGDFAELKVIENLTDLENGLNSQTQQKFTGLQRELALKFEKRMLKLPANVRSRKLQNYIQLSYGNPLNQVRAFDQMQHFLSDREMILEVASLKELALKRVENRLFELTTPELQQQFTTKVLTSPDEMKILVQAQADIEASQDPEKIRRIQEISAKWQVNTINIFGKDTNALAAAFPENPNPNLVDLVFATRVNTILQNSDAVSPEVKQAIQAIKQKTSQNFVANVSQKDFTSKPKSRYNPVLANTDVRLLLPAPEVLPLLDEVKNELPAKDARRIPLVQKAAANLVANHLLLQVNNPALFGQYQSFVSDNTQTKQQIQQYVGKNFFPTLAKKKQIIDTQSKQEQQVLYEKMQQIVQTLFVAKNSIELEKQLPTEVQNDIDELKKNLPAREVPKLEVPEGVTLQPVASLPSDVEQAIILAAKEQIQTTQHSDQNIFDVAAEAKVLGISVPTILPDNPLYEVKVVLRDVVLITKFDPIDKTEELLKQDNEKTLEAAILIENSSSQTSIDTAIKTLNSVASDFDLLKEHAVEIKNVAASDAPKLNELETKIIQDELVRQMLLSSIENKVHGDDYVAIEEIRANELKDGVDTLLTVTDHNIEKLTQTLTVTVTNQQNTQLDDVKAVELLNEIARTQPEAEQQVLQKAEVTISQNLETQLLEVPLAQRAEQLLSYAENQTGNPVRQFEAYDIIKDNFTNPQTILLTEELKDKATENLQERISEIPDANTLQAFTDTVIGSQPQDLKVVTEIVLRVEPPQNAGVVETLPIVQKVEDIKANIEERIFETYKDNPDALKNAVFFDSSTLAKTPDIVDIQVAKDIVQILTDSPEVTPEVIAVAKQEEQKIIRTFVENVSKPQFEVTASTTALTETTESNITQLAAETLNPTPETLAALIELKNDVPPAEQKKIDAAIMVQVGIIQDHLVNQVSDSQTFQTYLTQVTEDPVVAKVVAQTGGTSLTQAIEQKAQEIQTTTSKEQSTLETTVGQVQDQIFSSPLNNPSPTELALPQAIQDQIQEIKKEVPQEQVPQVTVTTAVSVTPTVMANVEQPQQQSNSPVSAPEPASAPAPATQAAPPPSAPEPVQAPSAPAAPTAPAENPAPAPAAPAPVEAPAAPPGL